MVNTSRMMKNGGDTGRRPVEEHRRIADQGWASHEGPPDDAMVVRSHPKSVGRALREDCQINAQHYFLATVLEDGVVEYYSESEHLTDKDTDKIFNLDEFLRSQRRRARAANMVQTSGVHSNSGDRRRSGVYHRRMPHLGIASNPNRRRRGSSQRRTPQEHAPSMRAAAKYPIHIANQEAVWEFYIRGFKNMQQTGCKLIAKAWIKLLAPKKQSTHPYTGPDIPGWWPKPWGSTSFEMVRHREPDHLKKYERVPLLAHMVRLVVEPNETQHPDIQKLNLTMARLEQAATDALSLWFTESPKNEAKRPFLRDILRVAKMEEQFKRGEIGEETYAMVSSEYKIQREDDDDNENDETESTPTRTIPSNSNLSIVMHDHSSNATIPGPTSMMALPAPMAGTMSPQQSPYVDHPASMQIDDNVQSQHGSARRPSLYTTSSPSEYAGNCGPQVPLYPPATTGSSWPQSTTTAPSPSLFAFSHNQTPLSLPLPQPQGQAHSSAYVTHMDVQMGHQQFMGSAFDALPNPNSLFRSGGGNPGNGAPGYGQRGYSH